MTDGDKKRKAIFDRYADNLAILIDLGILKLKYARTYICPICTNHFSTDDLNQESANPLTLEDAPPKSLGGKASILTCKKCNGDCGRYIDFHLTEKINEIDILNNVPGSQFKAQFDVNGTVVEGSVTIQEDGTMQAYHTPKNNNPKWLDGYIDGIKPDVLLHFTPQKSRVDNRKVSLALLKIAYLMTFEKYGYAFILHNAYDKIRYLLLNPEEIIEPDISVSPSYAIIDGVPFIVQPGMQSVSPFFVLDSGRSKYRYSVIIPFPNRKLEDILITRDRLPRTDGEFNVNYNHMNGDYLADLVQIDAMIKKVYEE